MGEYDFWVTGRVGEGRREREGEGKVESERERVRELTLLVVSIRFTCRRSVVPSSSSTPGSSSKLEKGRMLLWLERLSSESVSSISPSPLPPRSNSHSPPSFFSPLLSPPSHLTRPLTQRDWHLWRRKYNLFLSRPSTDPSTGTLVPSFDQFASIDERFWAWEFWLRDAEGRARGSVSRNFGGFGREIFTDTGES